MIHGTGGSAARFDPFRRLLERDPAAGHIALHTPDLPGFGNELLPNDRRDWGIFLEAIEKEVADSADAEWLLYGHGSGASLLLELARRQWELPQGTILKSQKILLHGCVGARLKHRRLSKVLQPQPVRFAIKTLVGFSLMRPLWERELFLYPDAVPPEAMDRFFKDYRSAKGFIPVTNLLTRFWYESVLQEAAAYPFHFWWGDGEPTGAGTFWEFWQRDFPNAQIEIIPGWDHFVMLDQAPSFYQKIMEFATFTGQGQTSLP